MKIAICDDELNDLKSIHEYINTFDPLLSVTEFQSASTLLKAFKNNAFFDLVFMDIEMESPNGYEASVLLSKQDPRPQIIFTTKSPEYTIQGYGIAMRYLMKPFSYEQFHSAMVSALEIITPKKLIFRICGADKVFDVNKIRFFEVLNHEILLHSEGEIYSFRCSLAEIMAKTEGCNFVQPHKSYYVNLDYINSIQQDQIFLITGEVIRISRDKKKGFDLKLRKFLRG